MKKFFSSVYFWPCVAALMAIFMISTPFVIHPRLIDKGPSWMGLDVSWTMTLNYALAKHLVWGKDILYNYGPLAFLSTRVGWGISKWAFVLFDGFLLINFYFVFKDFLKNNKDKFMAVAILICTMLAVKQCFGTDLSWIVLFFVVYWMIKTFYEPKLVYLAILILLSLLAFYIKLNTGLIAIFFLGLHFINLWVFKKIAPVKLIFIIVFFVVLLIASALVLHVSVFSYTFGSLDLIKGFNDIMYLDESHPHIENNLYLLFFAILFWFLYILWEQVKAKKYSLIIYTVFGIMFIFLLQKQGVLRNDSSHLYEFFSVAPLMFLCGFAGIENQKPHLKYSLVFVLFALFFIADYKTIDRSFSLRLTGPSAYIEQVNNYDPLNYFNHPNKRYIPKRVLDSIGRKSVDVFPWDSEYALENKLNYKPRPVFQSFTAFTETMEKMNYDYYVKQAPDILIYDYDAIDGRYPFNEESQVNLFILNNYKLVDSFTSNERPRIILKRNSKTAPLQLKEVKKGKVELKDEINITGANFIKLDLQYSLRGKIITFLHKPPHLQICYLRDDGQWFRYKTSVELLKAGIFVGDLVTNDDEYQDLITGKPAAAIKKIKFEYDGRYFKQSAVMDAYRVNLVRDIAAKAK